MRQLLLNLSDYRLLQILYEEVLDLKRSDGLIALGSDRCDDRVAFLKSFITVRIEIECVLAAFLCNNSEVGALDAGDRCGSLGECDRDILEGSIQRRSLLLIIRELDIK